MLEGLQRFISPEPGTGDTPLALTLHIGSKVVALVGILVFVIGIGLWAMTFASKNSIETTGTITEIIDLPGSDLQRVTIEYMNGQSKTSATETTSEFRKLNHMVGNEVELLIQGSDVIMKEAIPSLRNSFIKTSLTGIVFILVSLLMRKMSRKN